MTFPVKDVHPARTTYPTLTATSVLSAQMDQSGMQKSRTAHHVRVELWWSMGSAGVLNIRIGTRNNASVATSPGTSTTILYNAQTVQTARCLMISRRSA